uniref:RING-type domain-containing protein n=1 Tax=Opuntia streptacantha TaxID=393608 RepID=A0A7C9F993_OPUST
MAIVGLHKVPVIDSSILRESQPSSSSGRHGRNGRISTRASSLLRMWRELEDECTANRAQERGRSRSQQVGTDGVSNCQDGRGGIEDSSVSENGSVNNSEGHIEPLSEHEDHQSVSSEQSQDLSEVERERVRQIFREWMSSGVTVQAPSVPHLNRNSRGQWLGETERERVRVVREWIQMTSEQRESSPINGEEQVAEIGSQIERVRDGQILDHNEGRPQSSRREIRRLCGRQALLELLAKKEQERQQELHYLGEARPVSNFAHRNRIQALLRLRCFQNSSSTELRRNSSAAESELGLLRQRQTVSGLREGFLSRLDKNAHLQASESSDEPSDNADGIRDNQMQVNSAIEEPTDPNGDGGLSADLNQGPGCSGAETSLQELIAQVEARLEHTMGSDIGSRQENDTIEHSNGSGHYGNLLLNSIEPSRSESAGFDDSVVNHEVSHQQYDADREETNVDYQSDNAEAPISGDVNGQEPLVQVEDLHEQSTEHEEREQESGVLSNQWGDDDPIEMDGEHLGDVGEESSHNAPEDDGPEDNDNRDNWNENGSQETPRDWLAMPSAGGATSSGRVDSYYFSDDDNVHNIELRELLNRRRVSSLLHSGFRESLDQLIQSYVDRQTHAPDDWELRETSSPPFVAREPEQLTPDHDEESVEAGPAPMLGPQGHWGRVLHHTNWSRHELRQRPGTDWEIINDLRIDMARLQQRLTNMQRILEACMDMQLELQRSVRQEVSAALNRSVNPSELPINNLARDSFKWDCVRKGICCICSDSNIDSLLYRCGHMCTCTKCANVLVQGNGKCPMCQAPVVEVVRAYFIQE